MKLLDLTPEQYQQEWEEIALPFVRNLAKEWRDSAGDILDYIHADAHSMNCTSLESFRNFRKALETDPSWTQHQFSQWRYFSYFGVW